MTKGNYISKHIKKADNIRLNMFDCYLSAFNKVATVLRIEKSALSILDLGCGRGEFISYAKAHGFDNIEGCDFDDQCIAISKTRGRVFKFDIGREKLHKHYDIIVMSHVLEHLVSPVEVLSKIRESSTYLLLSVPNTARPNLVFNYNLRQKHYCNRGHYYSWDPSHFRNFLDLAGFKDIVWLYDDCRFPSFPGIGVLRRFFGVGWLERKLVNWFPWYSTSNIALVVSEIEERV